nr:unnamed protein product [Callosobruchus analis]
MVSLRRSGSGTSCGFRIMLSELEDGISCPVCLKSYETVEKMKRHKRKIHDATIDEYQCDLCPKVFSHRYKLSSHKYIVHRNKDRYKCDVCSSTFYLAFHLKTHKERFHENIHRFYCEQCKKGFPNQKVLDDHNMIEHFGCRYYCEYCGKAFKNLDYFKQHMITHSEDYVPIKFPCNTCDKVFTTRQGLNLHKRTRKCENNKACDTENV